MKKDIHPEYFKESKAICACGATFSVGSTMEKIEVEICSNCHPFYTGQEKILDTAGRVEKFKARASKVKPRKKTPKVKKDPKSKTGQGKKDKKETKKVAKK